MQAQSRVLARRYAKALFQACGPAAAARAAGELAEAAKALAGRTALFRHPRLDDAGRKALLREALAGAVSEGSLRLLDMLLERRRLDLLPLAAEEFGALADEAAGVLRARVRTASELSPEQGARLGKALEAVSGRRVSMEVSVAPDLLAGAVVRMGDLVLDGSLQGRIERLREELARPL